MKGDYTIFSTRPIPLFFRIVTAVILIPSARQAHPAIVCEEPKEAQV
jgi:hypothetical protein